MAYQIHISRNEENLLEIVPQPTALELERRLAEIAQTAVRPAELSAMPFAIEVDGVRMDYQLDHSSRRLVVTALHRNLTASS